MHILLSQRPLDCSTLTPSQVEVKLRDEAGHEDVCLICQEVVALVSLMDGICPSGPSGSYRLPIRAHVSLEIKICLGAHRGGHIGEVGHQVVLIERSGHLVTTTDLSLTRSYLIFPPRAPVLGLTIP